MTNPQQNSSTSNHPCPELKRLQGELEMIDGLVVRLLAERRVASSAIGRVKYEHHLPTYNASREEEKIKKAKDLARQLGANPDMIEEVYRLIMADSRLAQQQEYDQLNV